MNMWSKPRGNRRPRPSGGNEPDPIDKDYGFGYSEEGRPITGITDGEVFDPTAPIHDPKGETTYHDLTKVKAVAVCAPDQHNLVPDLTETDFEAVTCTRCPYGCLVKHK